MFEKKIINESVIKLTSIQESEKIKAAEELINTPQLTEDEKVALLKCLNDPSALVKIAVAKTLLTHQAHLEEVRKTLLSIYHNAEFYPSNINIKAAFDELVMTASAQVKMGLENKEEKVRLLAAEKLYVLPYSLDEQLYANHLLDQMQRDGSELIKIVIAQAVMLFHFINPANIKVIEEDVNKALETIFNASNNQDELIQNKITDLLQKILRTIGHTKKFQELIKNQLANSLKNSDLPRIQFFIEKIYALITNPSDFNKIIEMSLKLVDKQQKDIKDYLKEKLIFDIDITDLNKKINKNIGVKEKIDVNKFTKNFKTVSEKIKSIKDKKYLFSIRTY